MREREREGRKERRKEEKKAGRKEGRDFTDRYFQTGESGCFLFPLCRESKKICIDKFFFMMYYFLIYLATLIFFVFPVK
jgi:hypothetical protein